MTIVCYDGTYEGWLTAVFEVYEYKLPHVHFTKDNAITASIFSQPHQVITHPKKCERVLNGLKQKLSEKALHDLYKSFLSEIENIEDIMWRYVQYVFASPQPVETDFSNPAVLTISQTGKKVHREKHRMEAFVRFQLTKDGLYYAVVEPDFNVLPLIIEHFQKRYADQRWLIYDARRKYGIYYDLQTVAQVQLNFNFNPTYSKSIASICDPQEDLFQHLWQRYFNSVNIKARKNMKLHIQHMPKRYWKHLTEKASPTYRTSSSKEGLKTCDVPAR